MRGQPFLNVMMNAVASLKSVQLTEQFKRSSRTDFGFSVQDVIERAETVARVLASAANSDEAREVLPDYLYAKIHAKAQEFHDACHRCAEGSNDDLLNAAINAFGELLDCLRSKGLYPTPFLSDSVAESSRKLSEESVRLAAIVLRCEQYLQTMKTVNVSFDLAASFSDEASAMSRSERLWLLVLVLLNVFVFGVSLRGDIPIDSSSLYVWVLHRAVISVPILAVEWVILRQYAAAAALGKTYRFKAAAARALPRYVEVVAEYRTREKAGEYLVSMCEKTLFTTPSDAPQQTPLDEAIRIAAAVRSG